MKIKIFNDNNYKSRLKLKNIKSIKFKKKIDYMIV